MGAAAQYEEAPFCERFGGLFRAIFIIAAVVSAVVALLSVLFPADPPVYSVAIAGVAGLDPARDLSAGGRPTLSPVMNLTVHVNNKRNAFVRACVPILSAATVSYGDVFLAKGSVPEFCAGTRRESARAARMWGQDVVVPRFLRDQLAGELAVGDAVVDVQVTMPKGCSYSPCSDALLVCKAKIGGGLSRCQQTHVQQRAKTTQSLTQVLPTSTSNPPDYTC